jgi:aryl-alcohol dehydrogenase-like predicted oxidoreductase
MIGEPFGDSGVTVSAVGLGCNNFGMRIDLETARAVVDAALDAGITHLDTAESYGGGKSEEFLGEILRGRRDQVVLATKFGWNPEGDEPGGSPAYVRAAAERSLQRLGFDTIDILYYHRPDGVTPIAETLGAMRDLIDEGKVRAIACSNFDAALLTEADDLAREDLGERFTGIQNQYSLLERDADEDILPLARERDVAFIPYFPLASGVLTGKYRRGHAPPEGTRLAAWGRGDTLTDALFDQVDRLDDFAAARGRTLHQLAIAALTSTPGVASVIAGATTPEQVRANAGAADWQLTEQELAELPRFAGAGVRMG